MPLTIQDVPPGTSKEIHLEIERLPSGTLIDLPVLVYRGAEPGPTLLLTAALHGDEVNGTETLRRLAALKKLHPQRGAILAVPIVNVYGFLHQTRTLPDGRDLNRSFPGFTKGSLASRLARTLMTELVEVADYVVDLHTGGANRTNYPQVRCDFEREDSVALARAFGAPMLLHSSEIGGSFRESISSLGKTAIVYEGGESLRFDELAIQKAMDGILRLMHHLDMCDGAPEPFTSLELVGRRWLRAEVSGMFIRGVEYGREVQEGRTLAHMTDPYGHQTHEIIAPFDGYVIGVNNQTVVHAGDALIHLGQKR